MGSRTVLSIAEYYLLWLDFQQLKAYIANHRTSLDDKTELDLFIANSAYPEYLASTINFERRHDPQKYASHQLVETLTKLLASADSPAKASLTQQNHSSYYSKNKRSTTRTSFYPKSKRDDFTPRTQHYQSSSPLRPSVNALSIVPLNQVSDDEDDDYSESRSPTDVVLNSIQIKIPPDEESAYSYEI